MNMSKTNLKNSIPLLLAWCVLPLAYLAWCFSTLIYANGACAYMMAIAGLMAAGLYFYVHKWLEKAHSEYAGQLAAMERIIILFAILLLPVLYREYEGLAVACAYISVAAWLMVALCFRIRAGIKDSLASAGKAIKEHIFLILLLFVVTILSVGPDIYQFKWDGLLYYKAVSETNISSISSVALYGHISQTAGTLYGLFALLTGDVGHGMIMANILVLLVGISGFYACMSAIAPGKSDLHYTLATLPFAFSPFLLGMSGYYSLDWFAVTLSTWLIYFVIKRQWLMTLFGAAVFVMTKEPSLIAYGGLCLGLVICDLIRNKGRFSRRLLEVIKSVHYYFMLIPILLWLVTYKMLGAWSAGNGGFALDGEYIGNKCSLFLTFNFNWLVTLILAVSLIIIIAGKRFGIVRDWVLPLLISNACLLAFNLVFATVNHPRYIDSFITLQLIMAAGLMLTLTGAWRDNAPVVVGDPGLKAGEHSAGRSKQMGAVSICIFILWSGVNLCACYISYDPVSKALFNESSEGEGNIYSTENMPYGDMSIYNRQMLWLEKPVNMALSKALQEGSTVVFSANDSSVYSFDGMSELINLNEHVMEDVLYWDEEAERRLSYADVNRTDTPITYYHVSADTSIDELPADCQDVTILYIAGVNDPDEPTGFTWDGRDEYTYRGWKITADRYVRD